MMDVKLRKPQMARVMIERMRKLFGGGYSFGVGALMGGTGGCTGAWEKNECLHLYNFVKEQVYFPIIMSQKCQVSIVYYKDL